MPLPFARKWILPPREHPLTEIEKLVVRLELIEDRLGVGPEPLDARDPVKSPLGRGSMWHELHIGVKERANLHLVHFAAIQAVVETAHDLDVLLRHRLLPLLG